MEYKASRKQGRVRVIKIKIRGESLKPETNIV